MNDFDYVGALRKNWMWGAAVFGATLLIAAIAGAVQQPVYESAAQLIVAPAGGATMDTSDVIRSVETLERRTVVATFARIPSTEDMRSLVATRLRLDAETAARYRTRGTVVPNTNILRVDTQGPDPGIAARIANLSAELLAIQAQQLYRVYTLQMLSRASAPREPILPNRSRILLVGFVIGLALAFATVFALERVRGWRA
ncbi:MAG TPA: Wzz/FepE/Etk N-terminal domain-containing protein [Thermoanaerobaculia bacterium]|nr:Wzz/FepE/Etk N-terminal domain-containing protein [Thermoanaerobaculia bacterium]